MEVVLLKSLFAFIISFLVTFYLVPICCRVAYRLQIIDQPDGKIKLHKEPTPYLGGLAVYVGFLIAFCLVVPLENNMLLFFAGSTLLLLLGLIDDLMTLKPYQKFFGQIIASLFYLKAGLYLKSHFFAHIYNIPISFLWILSLINAFNLIDVMDGLASVTAIMASATFLLLALYFNNTLPLMVLSAFIGPLLAFLWYNKPNAKIYLGDTGSLFIGGFLATIPFLFDWGVYNMSGYLTPIIILAIPLLELFTLIIIRSYKGIPFYKGSPDHFSMYLQKKGWHKKMVLLYVIVVSLVLHSIALAFFLNRISFLILLIVALIFLTIWYGIIVLRGPKSTQKDQITPLA